MPATPLFNVIVLIRGGGSLKLSFGDQGRAKKAYQFIKLRDQPMDNVKTIEIVDDYDTTATFARSDVVTHVVEDVSSVLRMTNTLKLLNAYADMRLNSEAHGDPLLNGSLVMPGGPARRPPNN